jgi:adenine deaminase
MRTIKGNIVDIHNEEIFSGIVYYHESGISKIERIERIEEPCNNYILPGFIDSHVHIESSMLVPSNFARLVVPRGTIGVVTDPHEIANVLGVPGVEYMIKDSKTVPLKCFFGAPSCVPATNLESSGAIIDEGDIEKLLTKPEVYFLSEMMNVPGVLNGDRGVIAKINAAKSKNLPIDGHAPGFKGDDITKYAATGISTDHECSTLSEALDKIQNGMKIQMREGSAAKNFQALAPLFDSHPQSLMLCTDDSHPNELVHAGHIDKLIRLGLHRGIDLFKLLKAASLNPVKHYNLPVGLLQENDPADFIVIDNPDDFNILETHINGVKVYDANKGVLFSETDVEISNQFVAHYISNHDIRVNIPDNVTKGKIIQCFDGELFTDLMETNVIPGREMLTDINDDILKLVVVNRYQKQPVSVAFIHGFGLKRGAIASSVAHDSHNVVAVGVKDNDIVAAINLIMENKGGLAFADGENNDILPLPVAGLMSDQKGEVVASKYSNLEQKAHEMGAVLQAPFMSLSFMSLLVIPKLKLGDRGLFNGEKFEFISLFA